MNDSFQFKKTMKKNTCNSNKLSLIDIPYSLIVAISDFFPLEKKNQEICETILSQIESYS